MRYEEVVAKTREYGDFYVYFTKANSNKTSYIIGTTNLNSSTYIQELVPEALAKLNEHGELIVKPEGKRIAVFDWDQSKIRYLNVSRIKKVVPLAKVVARGF